MRKGVWLTERERERGGGETTTKHTNKQKRQTKRRKEREKLRVLRRRNYLARAVLLSVELLAGNKAFWAPTARGSIAQPQIHIE